MEGRWSPEDLLLSAVASCFTTTFRALADYSHFQFTDLEVEVRGNVRKADSGYAFDEIVIKPTLTIASEGDRSRADRLLDKAKKLCLVSRALAMRQVFEPWIHVLAALSHLTEAVGVQ
jgi:organic hydroperoxide reductase OsmC/OhrA